MGYLPYDVNLKTTIWIIVVIYLGIIAILIFLKARKVEVKPQREMLYTFVILIIFSIFQRIFFIFADYEQDLHGKTQLFLRYSVIAYIFLIIGFLNMIYFLEKHVIFQTRHIITYILLIGLGINIIIFFFPDLMTIVRYFNYCLLYSEVAILLIIYLYLITNTSGDLRIRSIIIFIGLIIMIVGAILDMEALVMSGLIVPYYTPILIGIGATLFGYALINK